MRAVRTPATHELSQLCRLGNRRYSRLETGGTGAVRGVPLDGHGRSQARGTDGPRTMGRTVGPYGDFRGGSRGYRHRLVWGAPLALRGGE